MGEKMNQFHTLKDGENQAKTQSTITQPLNKHRLYGYYQRPTN